MESSSEEGGSQQGILERRNLRSQYLAVKNLIYDEKDAISKADSNKFASIITQVENLYQHVQRPREQVADAEALLDIATSLATSVKSKCHDGPTPSEFISALLSKYSNNNDNINKDNSPNSIISWKNIGRDVSHIFMSPPGCSTMNGPMDTEIKTRKNIINRKHNRPTESSRPEPIDESEADPAKKTDTDKNMLKMFNILRQNKSVRLEHLILNRVSFSQTVENLFALSFLVKDGRAEITVDTNGLHFVRPRNAPSASSIASGEVVYSHFVFRFDIKDWKFMKEMVKEGEELMPHRTHSKENKADATSASDENKAGATSASDVTHVGSRSSGPGAAKTLTRNRGLVMREDSVLDSANGESCSDDRYRLKFRRLNSGRKV
ncbi:hypothetical protein LUZ60_003383 [Juncus effusus]|nr:hypothetical protein LUZ60_003383 [Juncus effusus]